MTRRIWLIAGPTASGKSALAVRLARRLDGEVVNADSMQLYRDIPILSAAPTADERMAPPHHLFGVADAADAWSTGRWLRAVRQVLDGIAARGRSAVIVGGTGLYFSALIDGLAELPPIPGSARRIALEDYEHLGEAAFRMRLAAHDPAAEARIAPADRQRLTRAWEVYAATGVALSHWQAKGEAGLDPQGFQALALEPPREILYARCDARLETMLALGVLDEVAALAARGLAPDLPAMKAVGVREFAAHLRGETALAAALAHARQETRRYAKRQLTWMRGRMAGWPRIGEADSQGQWRQVVALHPALTG